MVYQINNLRFYIHFLDPISMKILRKLSTNFGQRHVYSHIASQVKTVAPFVKVAHPEAWGARAGMQQHALQPQKKAPFRCYSNIYQTRKYIECAFKCSITYSIYTYIIYVYKNINNSVFLSAQ